VQKVAVLEGWQVAQLRKAAVAGRKNVEVKQLCKQTGLARKDVLHWLKRPDELPAHHPSTSERQPESSGRMRESISREEGRAAGRGIHAKPPPAAGGRATKPGRKLNRSLLATLENVLAQSASPSEEVVLSIVDLHNVPRRLVLDWFAERREDRKRQ